MIIENTLTDNNSTGLFGISYFIEKYIKYKLGLEKKYLHGVWDHRVQVFARPYRTLIIDFIQNLADRKELEIEIDNETLTNNDLSYNELRNKLQARRIIYEYITNMVKNILKTWNSLTNDKSKEKFLRALADMCILRKITLVSKRKMQRLRKTGIYRENLDIYNIKEGIVILPQVFPPSNDVLNKEWIEAQKEKPITTKEYLDLFGYTSGEEIYLCIDTIENCENALINDFKYIENVKKFEKRFSISPECKHQDPLSYYKQNLARDVLMHELGHVFGEQKGGRGLYCKQNENEAQMWSSIFLRSEKASMYIEFLSYFQPIEYCLDNQPLLFINGNTEEETIGE